MERYYTFQFPVPDRMVRVNPRQEKPMLIPGTINFKGQIIYAVSPDGSVETFHLDRLGDARQFAGLVDNDRFQNRVEITGFSGRPSTGDGPRD